MATASRPPPPLPTKPQAVTTPSTDTLTYPDLYDFPPFYTIQPVEETRRKQLQLWREWCLQYQRQTVHDNNYSLNLQQAAAAPLFSNSSINRSLSLKDMQLVIDECVRSGHAEWLDQQHLNCILTPISYTEWATKLVQWATDLGLVNQILTVYEIHSGDLSYQSALHGIDGRIVLSAVKTLERDGRASLIEGSTVDETGVKIFAR